ncbi:hypothetical protein QJQ45_012274 [Haematococcus lacustris]|nr:hypothetical protein QJQ45_012274 [Haematococcus lacustris]
MLVVLGIELATERTLCVALRDKTIAARTIGPACSRNDSSQGAAELARQISQCLRQASNVSPQQVHTVCAGVSGAVVQTELDMLQLAVTTACHADARLLVYPDAVISLASGTDGVLHGCVLVAGKSCNSLPHRALAAVSKASDGRGADTVLVHALTVHLGVKKPEDLIQTVRSPGTSAAPCTGVAQSRIQAGFGSGYPSLAAPLPQWPAPQLTGLPVCLASEGDTVSEAILRHGVGELLRSVKSVVSKLQLEECQQPYQVVLTGGLMVKGSLYTQYVHEVLRENLPKAEVVFPSMPPVEAAARLAFRAATKSTGGAAYVACKPPKAKPNGRRP